VASIASRRDPHYHQAELVEPACDLDRKLVFVSIGPHCSRAPKSFGRAFAIGQPFITHSAGHT
jgi:hypothetical protein